MKKSIFTLAAALCAALCLAVGANAASVVDSGYCGEDYGTNLTWRLDSNGRLTVSGSGNMADYPYWNDRDAEILSVVIGDSVTGVGEYAFYECTELKTVTLGSGVSRIGSGVFYGCASLTAINVSTANRSFQSVDGVLFSATGDVLYAYPAGKTQSAYTIPTGVTEVADYAFADCPALAEVVIPVGVTRIGDSAFLNCEGLESADIPDSVTRIGNDAFGGCASLTDVVIPNGVSEIGYGAFSGCASLTAIAVGEENLAFRADEGVLFSAEGDVLYAYPAGREASFYSVPSGVREIGNGAFKGCAFLTEAAIADSVFTIGDYAFAECRTLEEVMLPDSVYSVGNYAFSDCEALEDVYYGGAAEDLEFWVNEVGNDCLLDASIHGMASEPVSVLKLTRDGGSARATVYTPSSATAFLALYDGDGRFLGVEARLLRDGELATLTMTASDAARVKIMLLDEFAVPLRPAEET